MLEGLEVSVLNLSEVLRNNFDLFRLEAEYFKKEYLRIEEKFQSSPSIQTIDAKITCGPFGSSLLDTLYKENGILVVRPFNLKNSKVEDENLVYIDKREIENNNLKLFTKGTILFSRVGDIKIGILNKNEATISPNIIAIQLKNNELAGFLCVFYQTYYGFKQIQRHLKISAQPTISTEIIGKLKFPNVSQTFHKKIYGLLDKSFCLEDDSKQLYTQAESFLLQEIGLQDFSPSTEVVNIKSFKDSFGISGRLDAEYYQVKYEQIVEKIKSQKHNSLVSLVNISKSIEPGSAHYSDEKGLPFYRVSDYNKFGLSQPDKELTTSFVAENKELITKLKPKKDTILFSKDGSVGTAYLLREDLDGITSGAILHLQVKNTKEILPEYLTLALNSKLVQMQAERDAGGSIILHWRVSEIENVVVPIIPFDKQEQIAKMVEESFRLKTESEQLLETAKRAVEIAIEEDEESALKYLQENE